MTLNFKVGSVPIRVVAEDLSPVLRTLFSGFPTTTEAPTAVFHFEPDIRRHWTDAESCFLHSGDIRADALRFTDYASPVGYVLKRVEGRYEVFCNVQDFSRRTRTADKLRSLRWGNSFYVDRDGLALGFLYALWVYLLQTIMSGNGSSFVHASCVEKNGKALLFPAWGGVGKTSLMYQLVSEDGWKFLADDLAIVGADGVVSMNPMPIAVYPYNLVGLPGIKKTVMSIQSPASRFHWRVWEKLKGPGGVGRRIYPEALFGAESVSQRGQLEMSTYLVRYNQPTFSLRPISPKELAERTTSVLMAEVRQFRHEFQAWTSIPGATLFPYTWEIAAQTMATLEKAFAATRRQVMLIPQGATPSDVYAFLLSTLRA